MSDKMLVVVVVDDERLCSHYCEGCDIFYRAVAAAGGAYCW